jgi:hypothetical protein
MYGARNTRQLALLLFAGLVAGAVRAADVSPLSDFATADIVRESAFVSQFGDHNLLALEQRTELAGMVGQYAELTQAGSHNEISVLQSGDLNRVRVSQSGSANYVSIEQQGYRNSIDLSQVGSGNRFTASQVGNDNVIIDLQPGGSWANLIQIGDNNILQLNQNPDRDGLRVDITMDSRVGKGLRVTAR